MKIFYEKASGQIINAWLDDVSLSTLSPLFQARVDEGTHELADVAAVAFEELLDLDYAAGVFTVNQTKKTQRLALDTVRAARKARLKSTNPANVTTLPEIRALVVDLLDEWKGE